MENVYKDRMDKVGKRAVTALNANGFHAQYLNNKEEALAAALALITPEATVGMGGSMTVAAVGLKKALEAKGNIIYDHQGVPGEAGWELRRKELTCDVFLTSSNAVTLEGELINVDGFGNRVAAMTFGPKRIVMLVGANKIVKDEAAGRERIRMLAAPLNMARLNRKTPCAVTGTCANCSSPDRACNATVVLHKAPSGADFHIIVIGESLGY